MQRFPELDTVNIGTFTYVPILAQYFTIPQLFAAVPLPSCSVGIVIELRTGHTFLSYSIRIPFLHGGQFLSVRFYSRGSGHWATIPTAIRRYGMELGRRMRRMTEGHTVSGAVLCYPLAYV